MGLSRDSVGIKSVDCGLEIKKRREDDKVIALADFFDVSLDYLLGRTDTDPNL